MIRKPNVVQKWLHHFFMLPPVTAFFAPRAHRIDGALLKLTGGRISGSQILGWKIIQLTTTGAKTGLRRTVPLVGIFDGATIALIASSFGRSHNPGWYYNLKVHPACEVEFHRRSEKYIAHEAAGEEYERYWQQAISVYAGYDKYRQRAAHRHIPIMVLEPQT